jgi:hypothetical protein
MAGVVFAEQQTGGIGCGRHRSAGDSWESVRLGHHRITITLAGEMSPWICCSTDTTATALAI